MCSTSPTIDTTSDSAIDRMKPVWPRARALRAAFSACANRPGSPSPIAGRFSGACLAIRAGSTKLATAAPSATKASTGSWPGCNTAWGSWCTTTLTTTRSTVENVSAAQRMRITRSPRRNVPSIRRS